MPSAIPHSPTGLYWNRRGHIRCEQHALELAQTRWDGEEWAPIPASEEPKKRHYQCLKCSRDGNVMGIRWSPLL